MSIMCTVYLPEGIVMAADSRLTFTKPVINSVIPTFNSYTLTDNSQKVILLSKVNVGISFCGDAMIQNKTVADYIRLFEIEKVTNNDSIFDITKKLQVYLNGFYSTRFFICGYNMDIPYVLSLENNMITRMNVDDNANIIYNVVWNGRIDAITKLANSEPTMQINCNLMPLKDGIDLAEFVVDTTIKYERFTDDIQTCGGPIDVLVITKDKAFWHRHKIYNT